MNQKKIIIVGGGWAGLSAAVELCKSGHHVTLLEAAKQLGGRARAVNSGEMHVDNGQHLMIGAYTDMLALLKKVGIPEHDGFTRKNLFLSVKSLKFKGLTLKAPSLPAPINLLVAFLSCKGLSISEKCQGIIATNRLIKQKISATADYSVSELLNRCGIPQAIQKNMHIPLCIAALNTQPEEASARLFVRVMHDTFNAKRAASDFLFPKYDLSTLFVKPIEQYLRQNHIQVKLNSKVSSLIVHEDAVKGVILTNNEKILADEIIIAAHFPQAIKLIKTSPQLSTLLSEFEHLVEEPLITLYYQFEKHISLPEPMIGVVDGYSEWIIDRGTVGDKGLIAVVISSSGSHLNLSRSQLAIQVLKELKQLFEHLGQPKDILVLKESPATFKCTVGIDAHRPNANTGVKGLWLAGDYTNTGLPATLEGAIRSGKSCAIQIK